MSVAGTVHGGKVRKAGIADTEPHKNGKARTGIMQEHCDGTLGEPFQQRSKLMPRLCRKAGGKPFGFHALRHKAAAITFTAGGLAVAQTLMGHSRATTTDIYVRSAGLYGDRSVMMDALGESSIGIAVEQLLEMEMPRRPESREAFCKHASVNNRLQ